jgi:hypothetical protein
MLVIQILTNYQIFHQIIKMDIHIQKDLILVYQKNLILLDLIKGILELGSINYQVYGINIDNNFTSLFSCIFHNLLLFIIYMDVF